MALTRNKPLKKDVYRFVRWLREFAIGHERFVGYEEEAKPAGKPDPPRMPQGSGQTFRPASVQAPPRAAPAPSTPQASTSSTPGSGCLKCKSTTHKVRECPGITDDEAVRLLKAHGRVLGQKRGDWSRGDGRADAGRGRGTPGGRVATMRTNAVKVGREDLTATVDGVVPVRASLLDSGADLSVASGGLVSVLLAAGAAPEIIVMGPTTLRPYGTDSRPITVTKQVRLGRLEFNTGCGPLMLRGLRVWIDEAEAAVELTLGLPVIQKLGYSEQTLLENARRQQAVWDFADQPNTTPGIAMHRTLRMEELSDGIDDDEGMCCATPELSMIPSLADAKAVRAVGLLTHEDREGPVNLIHVPSATHSAACLTTRPIWCGAHQIRRTVFSAIATMRVTS
ncbi:hypothetical protein DYB37_011994 [Aphanomyces astaci]|uniref:Peptidase A2 domain-containing protein n=1 Tax=Aphanomyces astaci TaxID=112090 RepID=A0A3R7ALZ4_APHAT|nr:hypothetical protein DYB37_011994 [Aphanomyces astaci]